jgi:hypothetical protein|tara:strand:+ start:293 stop:514 length:222 start_codon:yes stop_codon:yes gene_type:complete
MTETTTRKGNTTMTTTTRTPYAVDRCIELLEVLRAIYPHFETLAWEYDRMSQDGKDAADAIADIFERFGKAGQ